MAIAFGNTNGKAIKNSVDLYKYKDNENVLRIVGGVLPRYLYWVKATNGKDIPVECLAFNRETERFDNVQRDYVKDFFPDAKCSWAYTVNCIDPSDGKVKALPLKKKLFEQIVSAAEDLGDPTDPDKGWDIVFKRVKTGPLAFNVEYQLQVLRCKVKPLTDAERQAVAEAPSIDEKYPRQTPEEVKALLIKLTTEPEEDGDEDNTDKEAVNELGG